MGNGKDIIDAVAEANKLTQKKTQEVVNSYVAGVLQALKADGSVQIRPIGTLKKATRKARTGRNPRTGAEVQIPAKTVPVFKFSKWMKESVK